MAEASVAPVPVEEEPREDDALAARFMEWVRD